MPTTEPAEPAAAAAAAPAWAVKPYSLVLGAVLALLALVRLGVTPHGVLAAGVLAVLAVLSAIDIGWRVLPNRIVLPATAASSPGRLSSSRTTRSSGSSPPWVRPL